jgi:hypothetical protein
MERRMGFMIMNKMWYAESIDRLVPQIMIGDYPESGGTGGEFSIDWELLGGDLIPRLKVYDDAWKVLSEETILLQKLGELTDKNSSQEDISRMLVSIGYVNLTEYTRKEK